MINMPEFLDGTAACTPTTAHLFDSTHPDHQQTARTICATCPLRAACAQHALDTAEPHGTWGGLTPAERHQLLSDDGTWLDTHGRIRRPCGDDPAYRAHQRYGEDCDTCQTAHDRRVRAQRLAQLDAAHKAGGTPVGAEVHRRLGEPVCVHCRAAQARQSRERRRRASRPVTGGRVLAVAS